MKNRRHVYGKIDNLQELRAERARLRMMMQIKELQIQQGYQSLKKRFSVTHLVNSTISKIGLVNSKFKVAAGVVGLLTTVVGWCRRRK